MFESCVCVCVCRAQGVLLAQALEEEVGSAARGRDLLHGREGQSVS